MRNSADPEATSGERILSKLKQPGGLLGTELERKREEDRKKKTYEQVRQYGKKIKEMYLPKADPTKQAEMEKRNAEEGRRRIGKKKRNEEEDEGNEEKG